MRKDSKMTRISREKIRIATTGENNPMFGKIGESNPNYKSKRSEETKARMRSAWEKRRGTPVKTHKDGCLCATCKAKRKEYVGDKNPFFGKHHSQESNEKNRSAHFGKTIPGIRGKNHYAWVENPIAFSRTEGQYATVHNRVYQSYGRPNRCENIDCSKESLQYEWSNKDHKYSLKREDWQMLCTKCHNVYDRNLKNETS